MSYAVVLRAANGTERTVYVTATTDQGASNAALKQARDGEMVARVL